jgi:hypothetical protein
MRFGHVWTRAHAVRCFISSRTPHLHGLFLTFAVPMADYDIFREQLAIKYPSYGHALWEPCPRKPETPVQVGDVGFIRGGNFIRLFNALLPADDPSQELGVPEYHEPLVLNMLDHYNRSSLNHNNYCSDGISAEPDPAYQAR